MALRCRPGSAMAATAQVTPRRASVGTAPPMPAARGAVPIARHNQPASAALRTASSRLRAPTLRSMFDR